MRSLAMIRSLSILACCVVLGTIAVIGARAQSGTNRYGGDYARFVVNSGDPEQCAARCEREQRCRAWTFSYPRTAGSSAICWLKSSVTPRVEDPCCVSGVKGGGVVE